MTLCSSLKWACLRFVRHTRSVRPVAPLLTHDFATQNDIMLANTRLAPAMVDNMPTHTPTPSRCATDCLARPSAQVTTYGHSASTHGSLIDWWVGGEEAELPLDQRPQDSYSERLLLVPGMGVTFRPRSTEPLHFDKPKRMPRHLAQPPHCSPFDSCCA